MAVKTDGDDARAIAHAMRVGWFTTVHVKTAESQELRLLLSNRRPLLEKRVAIDNEIRGTLKAFGLKLGRVTVAAFEVRTLELLADRSRLLAMVRPMLAARAALRQQGDVLHRKPSSRRRSPCSRGSIAGRCSRPGAWPSPSDAACVVRSSLWRESSRSSCTGSR